MSRMIATKNVIILMSPFLESVYTFIIKFYSTKNNIELKFHYISIYLFIPLHHSQYNDFNCLTNYEYTKDIFVFCIKSVFYKFFFKSSIISSICCGPVPSYVLTISPLGLIKKKSVLDRKSTRLNSSHVSI